MEVDGNGLEILPREECLRLLGTAVVGRVAVSTAALPTILPVSYGFDGRRILLRTGRGTELDAATRDAVVAFEVDDIEPTAQAGWSVVVTGVARELVGRDGLADVRRHPLERWTAGGDHRLVAISTDVVSGRRIVPRQRIDGPRAR
jgi:nitroimidazol reductase NimA-like FMN-containing flavoprotein (pyridoxamine 5'-phosphate oxidase superfamily)